MAAKPHPKPPAADKCDRDKSAGATTGQAPGDNAPEDTTRVSGRKGLSRMRRAPRCSGPY